MKKKKIITICIVLMAVLSIFSCIYLSKRKEYNQQLADIIEKIDIEKNSNLYKEEFTLKVEEISFTYKFRTNAQIKKLVNDLTIEFDTKDCYKVLLEEQISYDEMIANINKTISNSKDYGVGKVFVYTNDNYKEYLDKDKGYVDCSVFAYDLTEEPIEDLEAKIKIRGNSTATAPKKPYNIKFSDKVDLYGFGASKKWSFLAEYYDPTMMRNNLFLNFAKEMDLAYTSNCNYVEIWVDGDYNGCYLLAESVETGKNRVDIDVDNGDFLFEYEVEREEDGVSYITTEHGIRFAMSDPEELDEEGYIYVQEKINNFDSAIFSGDYSKIEKLLDIESFAKLYLLNEYAKTYDFGFSSVNFYYKEGKFYAGPAWDFDLSSGNVFSTQEDYWKDSTVGGYKGISAISYEGIDNWHRDNIAFRRLYEYKEFKEIVKEYFNQYSPYMKQMYEDNGIIDSLLSNHKELIINNYVNKSNGGAGWGFGKTLNLEPFDNYDDNVSYLKYWLENRFNYLDMVING